MKLWIRKTLGFSLGGLFVGVSVIVLALLWTIYHPDLLVNPRTMSWAAKFAVKHGIHVGWSAVETRAESISFLKKRFYFDFRDLCEGLSGESFQACFSRAQLRFVVDFSAVLPRLTDLELFRVIGGNGMIRVPGEEKRLGAEKRVAPQTGYIGEAIPGFLQRANIGRIWIEFDRLRIHFPEGGEVDGAVRLSRRRQAPRTMNWDLRVFDFSSDFLREGSAQLRLSSDQGTWSGPWSLSGTLGGVVPGNGRVDLRLSLVEKGPRAYEYDLNGTYVAAEKRVAAKFRGKLGPQEMAIQNLTGDLELGLPGIRKISLSNCSFRSVPGNLHADCPLIVRLRSVPRLAGAPALALPVAPALRIRADLETPFPPSPSNLAVGILDLEFEPTATDVLSGGARIRASLEGIPSEFPRDWRLDTRIESELRLHQFRSLVAALAGSDWAIPAPLNALDGNARVMVSGTASLDEGRIPVRLETQLDSRGQKFDVKASGALLFNSSELEVGRFSGLNPELELRVLLSDVKLVLPRLELRAPPRVLPDARMRREGEEKAAAALKYRIRIETPADSPVRLTSNLSKRPVPVHLNISLSDSSPMRGTIQISDFPLELFRRNASVQYITFEFAPEKEKTRLDGLLRVSYADYRVKVLLLGSVEEPRIQLTSDPPLPERQLLSVLLFGRSLEELDPLESESVGNARAAIADSALNLASLYFLAATPIESFGYDPSSGLFSAKVRLGEGTSLNVGAESGQLSQIGIRRRLNRFWTITTTLGSSQEHDSSVMAFLEWVNRY